MLRHLLIALVVSGLAYSIASAQLDLKNIKQRQVEIPEERIPAKIEAVIGFRPYLRTEGLYKVGLWTPVYIDILAGSDELPPGVVTVEAVDNDGVPQRYSVDAPLIKKKQRQTLVAVTKPGNAHAEVKITYEMPERPKLQTVARNSGALDLNSHIYLTLGKRLPELQDAIVQMSKNQKNAQQIDMGEGYPRFGAYEVDFGRLPDQWFGYNAVDMIILPTVDRGLLDRLTGERDATKLKAIAQWVRRGGRLVISVHWNNADSVAEMLEKRAAWQPPVPVIPPRDQQRVKDNALTRLIKVEGWAGILNQPFPAGGAKPVLVAQLRPPKESSPEWEVLAAEEDRPIIARMPYGMGSITLIAFNLDEGAFTQWEGRRDFFQAVINKLGPRVHQAIEPLHIRGGGRDESDLATQLHREQDKFDVTVVSFGWVALFILLYIVVVGPLDYLLLKKVFKRLEWTWITFPSVVILVSGIAYFTAYAIKGNDLKINKLDIIDIDLRTELTAKQKTKRAYAYGHSFFTILSPRIQNYTVGLEPALPYWMGLPEPEAKENRPCADVVSWMGRADWYSMGRTTGLFRRPYDYDFETGGVKGVPISVWTTKAFTASWEAELPRLPIVADLAYHQVVERGLRVSGTLENKLPIDLEDVWLFYRDQAYRVADVVPKGSQHKISLDKFFNKGINEWSSSIPPQKNEVQPAPVQRGRQVEVYEPEHLIRQLLFHEKLSGRQTHNHLMRPLDLSWRLQDERPTTGDASTREAILFVRAGKLVGTAASLTQSKNLPTYLWLDHLPREQKERAVPAGLLVQDTYFRIMLPLRPGD